MVRIPSEYQEVEYIESTGTQWIDTGVVPTTETVSQLKFLVPEYNGDVIYGFFDAEATDYRFFIYNGIFMFDLGGFRIQSISDERRNKIYEIELGNYHIKDLVTNIFYVSATKKGVSATCTITLNNYKNTRFSKCRWYYVKIYEDTVLVRNFIPCYRKSDNEPGMYDTVSKQFYTNSGTGTFLKGNDVIYDNINLLENRRRILLNTPHIESISDTIAGFKTDVPANLKGCKVYFTPIQEGEGDPSPENVRPITGWDGVAVYTEGRQYVDHHELFVNGETIGSSELFKYISIPIKNGTYIVSTNVPNNTNPSIASVFAINGNITSTPTSAGSGVFIDSPKSIVINKGIISIGIRSSSGGHYKVWDEQTFAPYYILISDNDIARLEKITIPFNRTIYGGYVDLVKGEVVEEYGCKTLNGTEGWLKQAANTTYNLKFLHALGTIPTNNVLNKGITEYIPEYTSNNQLNKDGILCCRFGWSDRTFYVLNATEYLDGVTDITTFKSYLAEHPLKIVYKLVTPNVYPLTPQTLKALRGMNNIWSNANGNIEVSFYTH